MDGKMKSEGVVFSEEKNHNLSALRHRIRTDGRGQAEERGD